MDVDRVTAAARLLGKARLIVIEQKSRIERLKAAGASTLEAERVLATFEANLRFFEDSLEQVRQQKD
jgi:hypothetical protein